MLFYSPLTQAASVKARCVLKAPSEPPSSTAAGGAFRRSCLSPRSGRVLRRPPDASSAGESAAKRMTGEAGSPFLPTSLATQRSRAPAGARPGQRKAEQRKSVGPHQRPKNKRGCRPGQRNADQRQAAGLHQRTTDVSASPAEPPKVEHYAQKVEFEVPKVEVGVRSLEHEARRGEHCARKVERGVPGGEHDVQKVEHAIPNVEREFQKVELDPPGVELELPEVHAKRAASRGSAARRGVRGLSPASSSGSRSPGPGWPCPCWPSCTGRPAR